MSKTFESIKVSEEVKKEVDNRFKQLNEMNIYYSNPYSVEKNFGKAINEFCNIVPNDNDWIVIQDGDMIYLTPEWGRIIYQTLKEHGDEWGLLGCYTNRLRGLHQLHQKTFSNDHNILNHLEIAQSYNEIGVDRIGGIAGVFMAFKKSTWKQAGGFEENGYTFDTDFCEKVRKLGMKIGLIRGLYVYHAYRPWSKSPQTDIKHLK